jgi:putative chitinase
MSIAIDRAALFAGLRQGPFPGKLTPSQVAGISVILDGWERSGFTDLRDLAYMLATPMIETGWTMQPIKERGGAAYYKRMYDIEGGRPKKARELGNIYPGDGAKFPGMGFVQSTGRGNARKLTALVKETFGEDVNFEETPERLMEPKYAALALIVGLERGIFTGRKLADYLRSSPPNWKEARRTVNALDRADEIAGYAKQIYADLVHAAA